MELNQTLEEQVDERTEQVRALASELTMAEQEERRRVSQVLHDDLQQLLYGVQMKMTFIRKRSEADDREGLLEDVDEAEEWIRDAITTTRQLTVELSPPVLEGEVLADALYWLRTQMKDLHDLDVEIEAAHGFFIADEDMRVLLFQLVRELLFNVVKHADTDRATVALRDDQEDGRLAIMVSDRGRCFDAQAMKVERHAGFGLLRMRERLDLVGGSMEIDATPGEGSRVTVRVPVNLKREPSGE